MAFKNCKRWTLSNALPVMFVIGIIFTIWSIYVCLHLLRLLQLSKVEVDGDLRTRGMVDTVVSQTLLVLMSICFVCAVFTDPGSVPDTAEWYQEERKSWGSNRYNRASPQVTLLCNEVKQDGGRRFCQKCSKYKPDRCHHCRVCNSCILRMDHHCPWIANCVGFRNHKYFFLLVLYAAANCWFIVFTMMDSVNRALVDEMHQYCRFLLVFGMTLAVIMGMLLASFLVFHCWLLTHAATTIEFCEKQTSYSSRTVSYNHGLFENIRSVLGPYALLWLLPVALPVGDGLFFPVAQRAPASKEEEVQDATGRPELLKGKDADHMPPEVTGAKASAD
eukprot:gb/GFBE01047118.1/.p1 GENE.gb/GFBE01047118.1/~~gb/GFBE01047118.1/.p1  ORF type:complete len:333 (+),score=64.69 gb/GFBE01047118.1/:1-999(+)